MTSPQEMKGKLAIATLKDDVVSETFIRTHIERLRFEKTVLSGSPLTCVDRRHELLHLSLPHRIAKRLLAKIRKTDHEKFRIKRLRAFLAASNVRAVLAEYGTNAVRLIEPCEQAKVPLIAHFHGFDASNRTVLETHSELYRCLFDSAFAIIGVSRAMCEKLIELGANPGNVHYIPYYVAPESLTKCEAETQPPTFLSVGRFVDKKAPFVTLLSFAKVAAAVPNARLRMIGAGELLGACKDLATALEISQSVEFEGAQNHAYVLSAMQECRCFVQHSVVATSGDSEGTPVAILEAQGSGLPVVATRHGGIPDVVVDGSTGFLCDERDVAKMADSMIRIAESDSIVKRMGDQAIERMNEHFGFEQTLGKLESVIAEAWKHSI